MIDPISIIFMIAVMMIGAGAVAIAPGAGSKPLGLPNTVSTVTVMLGELDSERLTTGNGATLVFAANGLGGSRIYEYAGRPNGRAYTLRRYVDTDVPVSVSGVTGFALMASSEGQLVETTYVSGTMAAWPTCTTIALTIGSGTVSEPLVLSCSEAGQGG